MTNETQTNESATLPYEVTFTLRQETMDSDVQAHLQFSHPPTQFLDTDAPIAFDRMVGLVQAYLYHTGVVDASGELIEGEHEDLILTPAKGLLN